MNGADLLCDTLLANDIDMCFANPGTSEMHFVAALDRKPQMRCVLGLSETVVTGAADGYARMADKPAATLLHLGPGLGNGLANLHNARRARTPVLNVVGDHATYHLHRDAPLTSDIEGIARAVSGWVGRANSAAEMSQRTIEAIRGTRRGDAGQVSTLILPADAAWGQVAERAPVKAVMAPVPQPSEGAIIEAAQALRKAGATLILGGNALRAEATLIAQRIAQVTGCRLRAEVSNRRAARGAGRVAIERIPYPIDMALADLASTSHAVLLGARAPVGFFAYPGKPGDLLPEGCPVTVAATIEECALTALQMLAEAVGVPAGLKAQVASLELPDRPTGELTAQNIGMAMARHLPENAVIASEGLTSGGPYMALSHTAQPHDCLEITGGAIGIGFPLAAGAALGAPDRKIVAMQADGSGAYSLQALWTQARERLDVITMVFSNRRYQILRGELTNVGANDPGVNATRMLTLDDPAMDWASLARGFGVEAVTVTTAEELDDVLAARMNQKGPFLIEMIMP